MAAKGTFITSIVTLLASLKLSVGQPCQSVTTVEDFDLDTYISARWYSQQQRPSPFQPPTLNFCTTADYTKLPPDTDFNDAYEIKVFNTAQDVNGNIFTSDDEAQVGPDPGPLCGLQEFPTSDSAKLLVGNCNVDPSSPFGSGPYWVLEYDEAEGYALISGGQPDTPTTNGLCTFSSPFNGLWIFTRDSERNKTLVEQVTALAIAQGIDPSSMLPVNQEDCVYPPPPVPPPLDLVMLTPKINNGCIQVDGNGNVDDKFLLATCDSSEILQKLIFDGTLIKLAVNPNLCMQAGRVNPQPSPGHFVRAAPCNASERQQQFTWENGGALSLVQFPDLAVLFHGVTANVDSDHIVLGDLENKGVQARKDWVIFN